MNGIRAKHRTSLQVAQRSATLARLLLEAEQRIGSVGRTPSPQERRRITMARKVIRACARELATLHPQAATP